MNSIFLWKTEIIKLELYRNFKSLQLSKHHINIDENLKKSISNISETNENKTHMFGCFMKVLRLSHVPGKQRDPNSPNHVENYSAISISYRSKVKEIFPKEKLFGTTGTVCSEFNAVWFRFRYRPNIKGKSSQMPTREKTAQFRQKSRKNRD